ncbi:MAG TPA: hypothetical protein VHL31_04075 [Geminicoccus sp.]|uniref:hypothetical protein n=1 Tax=Geminicoccus sp. TaxID=2024832 RepID=UPI002E33F9F3|nr:hypothetical protein [Geminicoccus sp.]HEX2525468.1 hypothetical protein [Geminicoccus sp.]
MVSFGGFAGAQRCGGADPLGGFFQPLHRGGDIIGAIADQDGDLAYLLVEVGRHVGHGALRDVDRAVTKSDVLWP